MSKTPEATDLEPREHRKRRNEIVAIVALLALVGGLNYALIRFTTLSTTLPFVNSMFFFGLINVNLFFLLALFWLIFRNVGKIFLERRRNLLGSRLKTKLVVAFLSLSIIPTLLIFVISSSYINSSFDKWFSIKIQNTLQASLEIRDTYYRNAERTGLHFGEHIAREALRRYTADPWGTEPEFSWPGPSLGIPSWLPEFLEEKRKLLALDAVEFYPDTLGKRILTEQYFHPSSKKDSGTVRPFHYPYLPQDILQRSFAGEKISTIQSVGTGELIRTLVPIIQGKNQVVGIIAINTYIPISLVNKVDEIASVFDDYKDTNPLKYPIKTIYFAFLVMITLVIIVVAIWIGLFMAKQLTDPVERLVLGAAEVGSGNLNYQIESTGQDEISVLIESFNKMTRHLKENQEQLTQASGDLERRRLQLEAVLANVGTGVLVVDSERKITTFNRAASQLLEIQSTSALNNDVKSVLQGESLPLLEVIDRAFLANPESSYSPAEVTQWTYRVGNRVKSLAGIATSLRDDQANWGVVAVVDDMTHLIKDQREMAWREVARRIAHEIKNPLTPIKLSAQRLQRRLGSLRGKDGQLLMECTETIVKHTDELKEMVNEFSNFARLPETSPAPENLNEVVTEVVSLYSQAHSEIRYQINLEPKLPIFEFDRDQIKRVLINLLENSISAMRDESSAKSRPHGREAPQIILESHFNSDLKMAVIVLRDNGPGMDDEVKSRVFEPYFSTKKEGTGLGLAIAKRIVTDHDGFIRVHSEVGRGTEFFIELPTQLKHQRISKSETP